MQGSVGEELEEKFIFLQNCWSCQLKCWEWYLVLCWSCLSDNSCRYSIAPTPPQSCFTQLWVWQRRGRGGEGGWLTGGSCLSVVRGEGCNPPLPCGQLSMKRGGVGRVSSAPHPPPSAFSKEMLVIEAVLCSMCHCHMSNTVITSD